MNQGGDPYEYNGELSTGDPIMLIAEFTLPSPEEREARKLELQAELERAQKGMNPGEEDKESESTAEGATVDVEDPVEEPADEGDDGVEHDALPSAPDLDALSGDE